MMVWEICRWLGAQQSVYSQQSRVFPQQIKVYTDCQ